MGRKNFLGVILMSSILIGYNHFFGKKNQIVKTEKNSQINNQQEKENLEITEKKSIERKLYTIEDEEKIIQIENVGGGINDLTLKKYNHEHLGKVKLIENSSSNISYNIFLESGDILCTKNLEFLVEEKDENKITLYGISEKGYVVKFIYELNKNYGLLMKILVLKDDLEQKIKKTEIVWVNKLVSTEKDVKACQSKTSVNFLTKDKNIENIKPSKEFIEKKIDDNIKWISFKQRFFTSAIISKDRLLNSEILLETEGEDKKNIVGKIISKIEKESNNKSEEVEILFYFGPNDFYIMKKVAPSFQRNISFGWGIIRWINTLITVPVFKMFLSFIKSMTLIILIFVIFIKLILFFVSYKSHISNLKMKFLKPKLDEIKETFKDNMQMIQIEQMKLYKLTGVNPFVSIGLLLLQMPIFIAIFNFIPNEISFRLSEFLWVKDLSTFDSILDLPFFIPMYGNHISLFTILMTISTILQTVTSSDMSSQQGNMKIFAYTMPVVFMVVLNSFPAALSFYYFISNIVTILIQLFIKKIVDENKIKQEIELKIKNVSSSRASFSNRLDKFINS